MTNEATNEGTLPQQYEHVDTNVKYRLLLDSFHITGKLKNVLDVGCGLGVNARTLVEKFGCKYYGVDIRDFEISEAEKIRDNYVDMSLRQQIQFQCGDATKLDQISSLPPQFDMAVSRHPHISYGMKTTFQNIFDSAFARLAEGGVFLVTTLSKNEYENSRHMFRDLGIEILPNHSGVNQYSNGREDKYVLLGIKS